MSLNAQLLRDSFAIVAPHKDQLANTFYHHLFKHNPSVVHLFAKTNMKEQKNKLLASIAFVVNSIDNPNKVLPALEEMGARHNNYGTKEEHYPAVGASMIYALAQTAGSRWNAEYERAWVDAYDVISKTMIKGSKAPMASGQ